MTDPSRMSRLLGAAAALALMATGAAADQTGLGPWNAEATRLAGTSALATTAMAYIKAQAATLKDPAIRRETEDAVFNPDTCIKSRANLTPERKQAIVAKLVAEGLIDETEAGRIPGGLLAGVFPGVRDDGTACPKPPQPYASAPGSVFGGHHSQPGGLAMHVAVNMTSGMHLADTYRRVYGTLDARGLPVLRDGAGGTPDADLFIDQDIATATPIWHDWAKTMVFQWNADGSEYAEMNFGGNGKTDAWGAPGSSKTGGHHILGVAEGMARGMPPAFLIAHASAHGAPNAGNEHSVVNWLRAAAIITGIDPVERGYLVRDALGRLRLAPVRNLGSINVLASLPNQSNLLYEYVLQNLSDADYTYTGPAVVQGELFLRTLAPKFGYDPADATRYNTEYRNPVLTHLSAERVHILYATGGIARVEAEVAKLKALGLVK
jgi:hypothetical protein